MKTIRVKVAMILGFIVAITAVYVGAGPVDCAFISDSNLNKFCRNECTFI